MTPPAQLCLLIRCALGNCADPAAEIAAAKLDGDALIRLATLHKLAPFLHGLGRDPELGPLLPPELRHYLMVLHELNSSRNGQIIAQLDDILALLNAGGITPVLLKGVARLVDGTYPDPGCRFMEDIDLLVPEEQLAAAGMSLREAGYGSTEQGESLPDEHHHAPMLGRDGAPAAVELHRSVLQHWHGNLLPAASLLENAKTVLVGTRQARLPQRTHRLVHLIAHSQLQHRRLLTGRIILSDLVECVLLSRRDGGEALQQAFDRAVAEGFRLPFAVFLCSCELATGERLPVLGFRTFPARLLACRTLHRHDRLSLQTAVNMIAHLAGTVTVFWRYPSVRRRFPGRLVKAEFYVNRWRNLRRILAR